MKKLSQEKILAGIKNQDNKILQYVYKTYYPSVQSFVIANSGSEFDAKDVFQEGIISVFNKLQSGQFTLEKEFGSYLLGTCRFIWFKMIRDSKIDQKNLEIYTAENSEIDDHNEIDDQLRDSIYRKHILSLTDDCQKVIRFAAEGLNIDEIAKLLGYKSTQIAYNKKYKCKEILIKLIKSDPRLKE